MNRATILMRLILQKSRSGKRICLLTLLSFICIGRVCAQEEPDYAVHANIIYRCAKYINWPNDKKNGHFIIGVVGETPLYKVLSDFIASKWVGNQKVIIRLFSGSESSFDCHILFIAETEKRELKKIAARTAGTPTLLITESPGLARKGSCINFIIVDDHLKLEINKNNIQQRNLGIAAELLQLGIIID